MACVSSGIMVKLIFSLLGSLGGQSMLLLPQNSNNLGFCPIFMVVLIRSVGKGYRMS